MVHDPAQSIKTARWGFAVMAELIPDDERAQRLWAESPLGQPGYDLERNAESREVLFAMRDDYVNRAFQRVHADGVEFDEGDGYAPLVLVVNYEKARRWLDRLGLDGDATPGDTFVVVHALRMVVTWVYAASLPETVAGMLDAAEGRARARVAADRAR